MTEIFVGLIPALRLGIAGRWEKFAEGKINGLQYLACGSLENSAKHSSMQNSVFHNLLHKGCQIILGDALFGEGVG